MERLTIKLDNRDYDINWDYINKCKDEEKATSDCRTKLGRLEDLEDEIGCPLEVICKALKQEVIYTKFSKESKHFMIENRFGKYLIYDKEWLIELKDYKKTWWLKADRSE